MSSKAAACQECKMPNADGYHPYLHCVLWKEFHREPEFVLAEAGYVRRPPLTTPVQPVTEPGPSPAAVVAPPTPTEEGT